MNGMGCVCVSVMADWPNWPNWTDDMYGIAAVRYSSRTTAAEKLHLPVFQEQMLAECHGSKGKKCKKAQEA